jgi:FtsP/CotA-like multicopper oxidase with cupredoxin domain
MTRERANQIGQQCYVSGHFKNSHQRTNVFLYLDRNGDTVRMKTLYQEAKMMFWIIFYIISCFAKATETVRRFHFDIQIRYAKLHLNNDVATEIQNTWPRKDLQKSLPDYLSVAVMVDDDVENHEYVLMGRPIHCIEGEMLELTVENNIESTGISIHFHGFEMESAIEYDGVVGLTQCPISPKNTFTYKFIVEESPGTYWYHTHSSNLGVNSHNYIKAPLIVHPNTDDSKALVDKLNDPNRISQSPDYHYLLSYENERILFFSDGFLKSESLIEMYAVGGLNPPVHENDDGFVAATMEHDFGTLNGKLREVIFVQPGETYKFRILNGGSHFAYRISIDGFPFSILATDSSAVKFDSNVSVVDEIIVHNAERFDVEITVPRTVEVGSSFWIRADTLESRKQGYENGIRGILHVVEDVTEAHLPSNVADPTENIRRSSLSTEERKTMNCFSKGERAYAKIYQIGGCYPIEVLQADIDAKDLNHRLESDSHAFSMVDFDASAAPLHAHFARIHNGNDEENNWYQFAPSSTHLLRTDSDSDRDLHPHTNMMHVPEYSSVIIIWRSRTIMDHPMHLHGYKLEILETHAADREKDCTLVKCSLYNGYDIKKLKDIPIGSRPIKDTFILPAGGAVATRIATRRAALWFAHCHMELHREDGMAFILNVGNYSAHTNASWLPHDFPDCNTEFLKSHREIKPHCDCYIDKDAVLDLSLDSSYKCSRSYLCMHEQSQVAILTKDNESAGFKISSRYRLPGWYISLIIIGLLAIATLFSTELFKICVQKYPTLAKGKMYPAMSLKSMNGFDVKPSFYQQFKGLIFIQWREYRPGVINTLRVVEVSGLGILAGILFMKVGVDSTATGFGEKTSLLFFSTTLWSQTRMYPAVGNYFEWAIKDYFIIKHKQYDLLPVFLARMVVVIASEAWWPFVFVLCAYPLADMFGNISAVFVICIFLALNNSCYISLGAVFGTLMPTVPLGMIGATLFAQTTVICAGFFTELPAAVEWIRYISPIFWTFKGIVKTAYKHTDTYSCIKGQSAVGFNECFLEQNGAIDDYKNRGINVATFGDPSSERVYVELLMLIILFSALQIIKILYHTYRLSLKIKRESIGESSANQDDHDEEFDKNILNLNRRSLFIKVDDTDAARRMTMRQSLVLIAAKTGAQGEPREVASNDDDFVDDLQLYGFTKK